MRKFIIKRHGYNLSNRFISDYPIYPGYIGKGKTQSAAIDNALNNLAGVISPPLIDEECQEMDRMVRNADKTRTFFDLDYFVSVSIA